MLGQLIRKEILEHMMSLRFAIACVLCLVVILCSLFVRCQDYVQVLGDHHEETRMEQHKIDTMDHPWRFVWRGVNVYRRPNTLKIFVRGVDDSYGDAVRVSSNERLRPIVRSLQNTAVPLFPSIDLVAFVGLIMSLLAIVFGYDAVCGEKERGTLRLMLSYSVPRVRVLVGKWIGGYVALVMPFLLTVIVGAVIVLAQRNIALNDGQWLRLVTTVGFALLYVAAVYSLSIYVSCLTRRASSSIMILLCIWVILVLALPNLSPHVAQILRPAANAEEVHSARRTASKEIWERDVEQKMEAYDKENGFGEKWWESVDWDEWESRKRAWIRWEYELSCEHKGHVDRLNEYAKIDQRYGAQMEAQIELSRWIARMSPFTCFAMAAMELADAGIMDRTRYMSQLGGYQMELCNYAHDEWHARHEYEMAHKGKSSGPWHKTRKNAVPTFHYVAAAADEYARMLVVDAGVLGGMTVVFFMLSVLTFLRYDVR